MIIKKITTENGRGNINLFKEVSNSEHKNKEGLLLIERGNKPKSIDIYNTFTVNSLCSVVSERLVCSLGTV